MSNYDREKALADLDEMGVLDPEEVLDYTSDRGFEEFVSENGLDPSKYRDDSDIGGNDIDPGCFLTTACIVSKGLPDNCVELMTLREYRDSFLHSFKRGRRDVEEYYKVAPKIVECINKLDESKGIWETVYDELVLKCVSLIKDKEYRKAYRVYKAYVRKLKRKYLGE